MGHDGGSVPEGSACAKALRQREHRGTERQPVGLESHEGRGTGWEMQTEGTQGFVSPWGLVALFPVR